MRFRDFGEAEDALWDAEAELEGERRGFEEIDRLGGMLGPAYTLIAELVELVGEVPFHAYYEWRRGWSVEHAARLEAWQVARDRLVKRAHKAIG